MERKPGGGARAEDEIGERSEEADDDAVRERSGKKGNRKAVGRERRRAETGRGGAGKGRINGIYCFAIEKVVVVRETGGKAEECLRFPERHVRRVDKLYL